LQLEAKASESYRKACDALARGDLPTATKLFRQVLVIAPGMADARYNLACALQAMGDVRGAVVAYRQCVANNPDDLESAFNLAACLFKLGDLGAAIAVYRSCLARHPQHLDTAFNLACTLQSAGKVEEAIVAYQQCLAMDPLHLSSLFNLASLLSESGDMAGAIAVYRDCMSRHPNHPDAVGNLTNLLISNGDYREAVDILQEFSRDNPQHRYLMTNLSLARWRLRLTEAVAAEEGTSLCRILVACMPKSGSTFLTDVLSKLPGMRRAHLVAGYGRREQEFDLEQLINHSGLNYVSQLHLRPSQLTRELLAAFSLRPVFLYRNIWDVMASLRDHMHAHSLDWSMARIDPAFREWDELRQYQFLARAMMPWFIDFYVSWTVEPDKLAVSYEELMADPEGITGRIAAWAGLDTTAEDIMRALAETGHSATFNKGGSGRGKAVPPAARADVEALARFYPDVDFTPLFGGVGQAIR